jgi:hypothetical protein
MPANKGVKAALELIQKDPSKILGLKTSGGQVIEKPGQYVGRKGIYKVNHTKLASFFTPEESFPQSVQQLHPSSHFSLTIYVRPLKTKQMPSNPPK